MITILVLEINCYTFLNGLAFCNCHHNMWSLKLMPGVDVDAGEDGCLLLLLHGVGRDRCRRQVQQRRQVEGRQPQPGHAVHRRGGMLD